MRYLVKAKLNDPKRLRHGDVKEFLRNEPNLNDTLRNKGWEKISAREAVEGEDYINAPIFEVSPQ